MINGVEIIELQTLKDNRGFLEKFLDFHFNLANCLLVS